MAMYPILWGGLHLLFENTLHYAYFYNLKKGSHDLVLNALNMTTVKTRYLIKGIRFHKYFYYPGFEHPRLRKTDEPRWPFRVCADGT